MLYDPKVEKSNEEVPASEDGVEIKEIPKRDKAEIEEEKPPEHFDNPDATMFIGP